MSYSVVMLILMSWNGRAATTIDFRAMADCQKAEVALHAAYDKVYNSSNLFTFCVSKDG